MVRYSSSDWCRGLRSPDRTKQPRGAAQRGCSASLRKPRHLRFAKHGTKSVT